MIKIVTFSKIIDNWQQLIQQTQKSLTANLTVDNDYSLSRTSKQISRLKKELDQSFPEFGNIRETVTTYNLYRELEILQQEINSREE